MDRLLRVIAVCLFASLLYGCGNPQPESPTEIMPDISQVANLESQMEDDFQNGDFDSMLGRMTPDFVLVGPDGITDRATWRARVAGQDCEYDAIVSLQGVSVRELAPTVVFVSSRSAPVGTCDGEPIVPVYASSVWVWQDGEWLSAAHQFTREPDQ